MQDHGQDQDEAQVPEHRAAEEAEVGDEEPGRRAGREGRREAAREHGGERADDEQHAERGDEARDVEGERDPAVQVADHERGQQPQGNRERRRHAPAAGGDHDQHRDQREHGADREVELAGHHQEADPERHDAELRQGEEDDAGVALARELGRVEREAQQHDQQHDERGDLGPGQQALDQPPPGRARAARAGDGGRRARRPDVAAQRTPSWLSLTSVSTWSGVTRALPVFTS